MISRKKMFPVRQKKVNNKTALKNGLYRILTMYGLFHELSDYGIILVNGEMDMLEYRLKLHRSIVTKFVIVKSNQT